METAKMRKLESLYEHQTQETPRQRNKVSTGYKELAPQKYKSEYMPVL